MLFNSFLYLKTGVFVYLQMLSLYLILCIAPNDVYCKGAILSEKVSIWSVDICIWNRPFSRFF